MNGLFWGLIFELKHIRVLYPFNCSYGYSSEHGMDLWNSRGKVYLVIFLKML